MSTSITTRQTAGTGATVKGAPLTNTEVDNNFIALNQAAQPTGGTAGQILAKIDATNFNSQWIDNYATQVKLQVKNSTGSTINKGAVVYISGASGANALISLALANADSTSATTVGFLESTLATGDSGLVIVTGVIAGIDTSTATEGDPVWLSGTTAGGVVYGIANKPQAPTHIVYLGTVTRAHATVGEIQVHISNGWELDELHDVQITSKANNDILQYNSTAGVWKNVAPSAARTNLGLAIGTNVQAWDADLDAIAGLAGTSGFLKKTAANTWSLDTSTYLTGNQSITVSGDATGSGTTAITLTLANSGVTAGTYTKVTVDAKGRVTTGASLASSDVTTALGYTPYNSTNPNGYTSNTGTVTSVSGTGTVSGLTLTGTVTGSGSLTLGGTLSLTSGQVTTALGYTPYNSTNPNGYTSNTGTVTSVSGTGSYGGLTLSGTVTSSGSLTLGGTPTGTWPISISGTAAYANNIENTQASLGYSVSGVNIDYSGQGGPQVRSQGSGAAMMSFHRPGAYAINFGLGTDNQLRTGGWSRGGNYVILDSGNYTSYSPSLTGSGASGTWGINITGNAGYASSAGNADTTDGLHVHSGTNNEANKIVRTDGNGYTYFGWINTISGNLGSGNRLDRVWCSNDQFMRYLSLTEFKMQMGLSAKSSYQRYTDYTSDSNYWVGSMGHSGYGANEVFHGGSGFFDIWSGTNYPSGTSHIHGFNALHYTTNSLGSTGGNAYGIQVAGQYSHGGELWSRGCSGGSFSSWRKQLDSSNYSDYAATRRSEGTNYVDYSRFTYDSGAQSGSASWSRELSGAYVYYAYLGRVVYNNGAYSGSGWVEPSDLGVRYANSAGSASSASTSSQVTINYNNDSNSTYQMLWGSGNSVYGTAGIYCNPSTDYMYAAAFQATSDESLKTNWRMYAQDYVDQLALVKNGTYDRVDGTGTQDGVSAQSLQVLLPHSVGVGQDGKLTVNYGNAAMVSAVELAKRVVDQEARIKRLESLIAKLIGD